MKNKRRLERFNLGLPATIELLSPAQEERLFKLITTNVCSGGAYFHTHQPLPQGTRVKIDLVLPLDKLRKLKDEHKMAYVNVTGTVSRSESGGMAIFFDEDYQITGSGE